MTEKEIANHILRIIASCKTCKQLQSCNSFVNGDYFLRDEKYKTLVYEYINIMGSKLKCVS
jgi:hypothetical protein